MNIKTTTTRSVLGGILLSLTLVSCGEKSQIQSHLESGEKFYQEGKFDEAKLEFLNLRSRDPKNATAHARLGEMYLRQGSPYRAVPYLLEAQKLDADNEDVLIHLAEVSLVLGAQVDARRYALEVLEKKPSHERALIILAETATSEDLLKETRAMLQKPELNASAGAMLGLAMLELRGQHLETAESGIRKVLAMAPGKSKAHLALALVLRAQNKLPEAEEEHRKAAELAPDRSTEKLTYAKFLIQTSKLEEAREFLQGLSEITPDYLPAWILLSELAVNEKDYPEAENLLKNVFQRDRVQHEARLLQAQIQMARGESKEVLENLKQLKSLYPTFPVIEYRLAVAYLMNAIPSKAIEALDRAIDLQPGYIDAHLLKARLNLRLGEPQTVVESMQALLKQAPKLGQAQQLLADAYRMQGRLDDAAAIFRTQIAENAENFQAHLILGMILRQQGKAEEARAVFEKAGVIDGENTLPAFQLAELDVIAGNADQALARIGEIIARAPQSAGAYFMIGRIHAHQKSWDEAEKALLKAIELEPNLIRAYNMLVATYVAAKKLPEAGAKLEQIVENSPENASALIQLALVQEELGQLKEAELSYTRAIALIPNFAPALNNLAWLYVEKLDEPGKALEIAQKARTLLPDDAGIADTLGWIYFKQKDYVRAVALLREAAAKMPDNPEVHYHLGMAASMMGQSGEARRALTVATKTEDAYDGKQEAQELLVRLSETGSAEGGPGIAELRKRVAGNPSDVVALLQLAAALEGEGEHAAAGEAYEKVRTLNPKQLESIVGLARLYHGPLQDSARAAELAKEARTVDPADGRPLAILGSIELAAGRSQQAHTLLGLAIDAGVDDPQVVNDLAWATYQIGEVQTAREAMQELKTANPGPLALQAERFLTLTDPRSTPTPELVDEARAALAETPGYLPALMVAAAKDGADKKWEEATKIYEDILSKHPDFVPAKKELAGAYLQQGEKLERSKKLAQEVRQARADDLEVASMLAIASYRLKDYRYAAQLLKEVDRKQPLDAEGLFYLAAALLSQDKEDAEGQAILQRARQAGLPVDLEEEAKRFDNE